MLFLQTLADGAVHVSGVDDVVGVVVVGGGTDGAHGGVRAGC